MKVFITPVYNELLFGMQPLSAGTMSVIGLDVKMSTPAWDLFHQPSFYHCFHLFHRWFLSGFSIHILN